MSEKKLPTVLEFLTVRELEEIEILMGKLWSEIFIDSKGLSAKATQLLLWILEKRSKPTYPYEEVGKLTIPQTTARIKEIMGADDPKEQKSDE